MFDVIPKYKKGKKMAISRYRQYESDHTSSPSTFFDSSGYSHDEASFGEEGKKVIQQASVYLTYDPSTSDLWQKAIPKAGLSQIPPRKIEEPYPKGQRIKKEITIPNLADLLAKKFPCPDRTCRSSGFKQETDLRRHVIKRHQAIAATWNLPFRCPVKDCKSIGYDLFMHLQKHIHQKHPEITTNLKLRYPCPIESCKGKSFDHPSDFNRHFLHKHPGINPVELATIFPQESKH